MTPEEVAALIGLPERVHPSPFGNRLESRPDFDLAYDANSRQLTEAVFSAGPMFLQGVNLFAVDDLLGFLRKFDPDPQLAVGIVFFVKLGLRLSGFHDSAVDQNAIGLTAEGHWDEFIEDFEPFDQVVCGRIRTVFGTPRRDTLDSWTCVPLLFGKSRLEFSTSLACLRFFNRDNQQPSTFHGRAGMIRNVDY
ncbi:MAG: hypothetical protein JSS02_06135 [Planctomycetes bacterium]|nr:hypothetical protein [Planctomycetota bacterium]